MYVVIGLLVVWQAYLTFLFIRIRNKQVNAVAGDKYRLGLVKFNPFNEVGGDQSFCLALLIDRKLGIILTSLHARSGTRVYARQVDLDNINKEKITKEEKEAIKKALEVE